jgi:hypothetical protein
MLLRKYEYFGLHTFIVILEKTANNIEIKYVSKFAGETKLQILIWTSIWIRQGMNPELT